MNTNPGQGPNYTAEATPEVMAQAETMNVAMSMSHEELAAEHADVQVRLAALEARFAAPVHTQEPQGPGVIARGMDKIRDFGKRIPVVRTVGVVAVTAFAVSLGAGAKNVSPATAKAPIATKATEAAATKKAGAFDTKGTVARTVESLKVTSAKKRSTILKTRMGTNFKLEQNNIHNQMNAVPGKFTTDQLMVSAGLAMASDSKEGTAYGKAAVNFNSKNNRSINADTHMTAAQEEAFNKAAMTGAGKTTIQHHVTGTYENGYMLDGGKMASQTEHFVDQDLLVRHDKDGGTVKFRVTIDEDGRPCINLVREVPEAKIVTSTPTASPKVFAKFTPKKKHEDVFMGKKKPTEKPAEKPGDKPKEGDKSKPKCDEPGQPKCEVVTPKCDEPGQPKCDTTLADKVPKPVDNQSVPGAPGSGGSPEQGDDPQNDSDVDGYGPGDTVATPTTPTPAATVPTQGTGTPESPIVNTSPTPVVVVPVTPTPPQVPVSTIPGTPTSPNGPAVPAN